MCGAYLYGVDAGAVHDTLPHVCTVCIALHHMRAVMPDHAFQAVCYGAVSLGYDVVCYLSYDTCQMLHML